MSTVLASKLRPAAHNCDVHHHYITVQYTTEASTHVSCSQCSVRQVRQLAHRAGVEAARVQSTIHVHLDALSGPVPPHVHRVPAGGVRGKHGGIGAM